MNTTITINKPKVRQSNFELLRIIAMFMVLILHADFVALGVPDKTAIIEHPFESVAKVFFEITCIVAVNVFVLISGWFGIKISKKGFYKFIFQFLFFSLGIYVFMLTLGYVEFTFRGLADCFSLLSGGGSYWFIPAYLCLYIISPVLNAFIESSEKNQFLVVLLSFFIFQTLYAFIGKGAIFLSKGYSTLSFVGLYLLAGYIRRYINTFRISSNKYLIGFWTITIFQTLLYLFLIYIGDDNLRSRITFYSNPFVIASSVLLLLCFTKIRIQSKVINWVGESSFAVYLLHCHPILFKTYYISSIASAQYYTMVLSIVITWFVVAIILDQIRKCIWRIMLNLKTV